MPVNHYVHIVRRRRQGKTDYRKRRGMIVGKQAFLSVRISGRYIYAQLLRSAPRGDITLCSASSRNLNKFGWKGSSKNLPGAFLTGYHLGRLAQNSDVKDAILYSGVGRFVHGSRIASLVEGANQAGLSISINKESFPGKDRVNGKHIADYARKLEEENKEKFAKTFSKVLGSGTSPLNYPTEFEKVKKAIEDGAKS